MLFCMSRLQISLRIAVAMTINAKASLFRKIGIYLPMRVFTHGHLYVALSRVKTPTDVQVVINETSEQGQGGVTAHTKNIVYTEILLQKEATTYSRLLLPQNTNSKKRVRLVSEFVIILNKSIIITSWIWSLHFSCSGLMIPAILWLACLQIFLQPANTHKPTSESRVLSILSRRCFQQFL